MTTRRTFLGGALAAAAGAADVASRLFARYAEAVAPPPLLTVSEWNDRYRILPASEPESGPWDTNRNPAFREVMNAFGRRDVAQVTVQSCAQSGKSAAMLGMIAWAIDQAPGPMLMVLPDETTAQRRFTEKIKPMIEASLRLRRYVTGWKSDWKSDDIRLTPCSIGLAWANSAAALADRSCRYVFLDEVGKFKAVVGKEADPVNLAKQRVTAFPGRSKIVVVSTPTDTGSLLQREWDKSDRRHYWVPCQHCGEFQRMDFAQVGWPKGDGVTAEAIKLERQAWYECVACKRHVPDTSENRHAMLRAGVWAPEGCTVDRTGCVVGEQPVTDHRGYHLHGLLAFNRTWSEVVFEFLQSYRDRGSLRNFHNSVLGLPFDEIEEETEPSEVERCRWDYAEGEVPAAVRAITAGVDVNKPGGVLRLTYVIRGWGDDGESWLIRAGVAETWEEVENRVFRSTFVRSGTKEAVPLLLACVDTGYETDTVYAFCKKWRPLARPIKGKRVIDTGEAWTMTPVERDRSGKRKRFGLKLWNLNTHWFKTKLFRLIRTQPGSPGEWHIYRTATQDYCEQVASEQLKRKPNGDVFWDLKPGKRRNDFLDAECYALAAAEMRGATVLRGEGAAQTAVTVVGADEARAAAARSKPRAVAESSGQLVIDRSVPATPRRRERAGAGGSGGRGWRTFGTGSGGRGWRTMR